MDLGVTSIRGTRFSVMRGRGEGDKGLRPGHSTVRGWREEEDRAEEMEARGPWGLGAREGGLLKRRERSTARALLTGQRGQGPRTGWWI